MTRLALLFDLDGTLVDTDRLHHAAYCAVLAETDRPPLSLADYAARVMGHPNVEIAAYLFPGDPRAEALIELLQAGAHQAIRDFADPALWVTLRILKARVA